MDVKVAEKASKLLNTLNGLNEIKKATENESSHWWAFRAPHLKYRNDGDGIYMPDILRDEFVEAVDRAIAKTKEKIEKL